MRTITYVEDPDVRLSMEKGETGVLAVFRDCSIAYCPDEGVYITNGEHRHHPLGHLMIRCRIHQMKYEAKKLATEQVPSPKGWNA